MVAGGFPEMSYTTREMHFPSLRIMTAASDESAPANRHQEESIGIGPLMDHAACFTFGS